MSSSSDDDDVGSGLCFGLPSLSWDGLNAVATVVTVLGFFLGAFPAILRRCAAVCSAIGAGGRAVRWRRKREREK